MRSSESLTSNVKFEILLTPDRVPNKCDEYDGLPHYFFAFPSSHLDNLRQEYFKKTADGIKWVIDSDV